MSGPRILLWDLENSPGLGYFWGQTWKTDIIHVQEPSRVMCFAAQWYGEKKVEFRSTFHDTREVMLERAFALLDEADAAVSWNGKQHDTRHIRTEFTRLGMGVPSPYREIDLCLVSRKNLYLHSNRLNNFLREFHLGSKVSHEGLPLWFACMAGDDKAWGRMRRYNIGDVRALNGPYELLLPMIPQAMHPNHNLYCDGTVCPRCGGAKIQRRGFHQTTLGLYQRWFCADCKGWSHEGRSVERVDLRGVS